jgi:hypothetical protein
LRPGFHLGNNCSISSHIASLKNCFFFAIGFTSDSLLQKNPLSYKYYFLSYPEVLK